ncbi:MAG: acylphosphatase [[Actinobacillus] rossii]|uniref:acylphosphatase n=1 Tax=[Actinobacillus] rossii TaxID=123820 RepID=A0A380U3Z3_9PAST|nr:acylphosphatase [[Actinobacillus] rossii]MDD7426662.1 acylphosphatase [[Actinobacillus] rossii]MDY3124456.1 acylphosphatase [[Actinobacillus] rossii]MDY4506647.1 acylphosphatase [[Actinobacillus] rossii]SUT95807.1 acylphosphatase [[Actinobacillus] rossii]
MEKRQFTIYGRVQGVGFRFYTTRQAQKLMLSGSVKNLSDGSVLVIAVGIENQIAALRQWLKTGSPAARVDRIIEQEYVGEREFIDFKIEH